jgi:hypothetical protein
MAGFTADAGLTGPGPWNAVAHEAPLFELGAEHAPEDGFIRNRSQRRKSRRHNQTLRMRSVQKSNFYKGRSLQPLTIDISDSREEAQTLPLATDHRFHRSFSRETAGEFHFPPEVIAGTVELVADRSLGLFLVEVKRQASRGCPSPGSRHACVQLCSRNLLMAPGTRGRSKIAAIQALMLR